MEHPFGTIKRSLGWDHYLLRGKEKVSGENALIMFCYNFKRVLNLLGTRLFNQLLLAIKAGDIAIVMQAIKRHLPFLRPLFDYLCQKYLFSQQTNLFHPPAFNKNLFYPCLTQKSQ